MSFFDFNLFFLFCRHSTAFQLALEAADESWPNCLFSPRGFPPLASVSNLRRSLPRQSLRQRFFLLGSVPFFDLCPTHLPRKSSRCRSLSARPATQAVSHGLSGPSLSQYVGARQRTSVPIRSAAISFRKLRVIWIPPDKRRYRNVAGSCEWQKGTFRQEDFTGPGFR